MKYRVIGLMSGTSLDGLDIAFCEFTLKESWSFKILKARTKRYSKIWREKLSTAHHLSGKDLLSLHADYGAYLGNSVKEFIKANKLSRVDLVASHGHTIFHQPQKKFTFQLGNGNNLFAELSIPVVCDFRSLDVARGGEGAPLVPIGDKLLFSSYDICINLGGIANLSMDQRGQRIAFDICFCNMGLNFLASMEGKSFDKDGRIALQGKNSTEIAEQLSSSYQSMKRKRPSLGREIFEEQFQAILQNNSVSVADRMTTFVESIAREISTAVVPGRKLNVLFTGGGAFNSFLMEAIGRKLGDRVKIHIPDRQTVSFKEAMVFGFLGLLKLRSETNVLSSVTNAASDSSSGMLIGN